MYLVVDIWGTKLLVAAFDDSGKIQKSAKFPTPKDYQEFLSTLKQLISGLLVNNFTSGAVAIPGLLDRSSGIVKGLGNLPWQNKPIKTDVEQIAGCPIIIENDAKAAGYSEAKLLGDKYKKVVYVTIGTGLGVAVIINGQIDPSYKDMEGGHIMVEHDGKLQRWESFASGRAIVERFGAKAADITDPATWQIIAHDLGKGIYNLIAIAQPDVVVIGGGVGSHFEKFGEFSGAVKIL